MKWIMVFILGVLTGALVAGLLVFFNPMLGEEAKAPEGDRMVFSSDQDGFVLSHGNVMPIPVQPNDAPSLWETTIKGSALVVAPLRNESNDVVALATRVSWLDEGTDFLMGGPQSQSSWILSYPGQGTLAIEQEESLWSIFRNGVISVWLLGQSLRGR